MYIKMILMLLILVLSKNAYSDSEMLQQVKVAQPYLEMHTGPGGGYPVFYVVARGEIIDIIEQRANWFEVRNQKGKHGWVSYDQISKTLSLNGEPVSFTQVTQEDFTQRNWEWGVLGGDFGGAPVFSAYGSYLINRSFATEVSLSQSIGDVSSSVFFKLGFVMQPFPEWEYTPFFFMGTGLINVKPSATLVQPVDQSNQFSNVSIGIRKHLTQQVIIRLEYSEYIIFSATKDNDNNEDIKEWKAGFAIFF